MQSRDEAQRARGVKRCFCFGEGFGFCCVVDVFFPGFTVVCSIM